MLELYVTNVWEKGDIMKQKNSKITEEIKNQIKFFGSGIEDDFVDVTEDGFEYSEDEVEEDIIGDLLNSAISSSITGLQLESIINSLKTNYFKVPGFQRKFIWTKKQVASLALSIIKDIPIPPLYVYVDSKTKKQVILDGQQRVTAMFLYFYGLFFTSENKHRKLDFEDVAKIKERIDAINSCLLEFDEQYETKKPKEVKDGIKQLNAERKKLRLELKEKYELVEAKFTIANKNKENVDISFTTFDEASREYLKRKSFNIAVVKCEKGRPQKIFANIFKVLNTGGKILGTQEIRNGIYWESELYKRLFNINENNENWRMIYGNISQFSKDVEILLKMLALNYYTECDDELIQTKYKGTFNWMNIMDGYSEESINFSSEYLDSEIQLLSRYFYILDFDDDIKKCNKAVFEAVFISFCKLGLLQNKYNGDMKLKLTWLKWLEDDTEIFEHVLSNKASVEERLTGTYKEVRKQFAKYL